MGFSGFVSVVDLSFVGSLLRCPQRWATRKAAKPRGAANGGSMSIES